MNDGGGAGMTEGAERGDPPVPTPTRRPFAHMVFTSSELQPMLGRMATTTPPRPTDLINAIAGQISASSDRRAQRFLDDLRQEGLLPGRRNRWVYRLHWARQTLAGWLSFMIEFGQLLFTGRRPASYWVELMEQLIAEGQTPEDAARKVKWDMESEDARQHIRWVAWPTVLVLIAAWLYLILSLANVI